MPFRQTCLTELGVGGGGGTFWPEPAWRSGFSLRERKFLTLYSSFALHWFKANCCSEFVVNKCNWVKAYFLWKLEPELESKPAENNWSWSKTNRRRNTGQDANPSCPPPPLSALITPGPLGSNISKLEILLNGDARGYTPPPPHKVMNGV